MSSKRLRHLISSEDWSTEKIDEALALARQLRDGGNPLKMPTSRSPAA